MGASGGGVGGGSGRRGSLCGWRGRPRRVRNARQPSWRPHSAGRSGGCRTGKSEYTPRLSRGSWGCRDARSLALLRGVRIRGGSATARARSGGDSPQCEYKSPPANWVRPGSPCVPAFNERRRGGEWMPLSIKRFRREALQRLCLLPCSSGCGRVCGGRPCGGGRPWRREALRRREALQWREALQRLCLLPCSGVCCPAAAVSVRDGTQSKGPVRHVTNMIIFTLSTASAR